MIRLALVLLLVSTTLAVAQISSLVWPGPGTPNGGGACTVALSNTANTVLSFTGTTALNYCN